MRLLITGATGYIGQHVAAAAIARGWEVHAFSRPESSPDRLRAAAPGVKIHTVDLTPASIGAAVAAVIPDVTCHLASDSRAEITLDNLSPLLESNIVYGALLCHALMTSGCKRFINTGSWWEYGRDGSFEPNTIYAASKRSLQDLLVYYARRCGMAIITLVLFDIYGQDDWRGKFFPTLVAAAREGRAIETTGGEQMLDLVHVDDVAQGFLSAAELTAAAGSVAHHQVFGLSSGQQTSLRQMVGLLEKALAHPIDVQWGKRPYPPHQLFHPTRQLETLPGWRAERRLEDELTRIVQT